MGNPVVVNIIKSGGVIFYAPVGEVPPDESTVLWGDAWGGNWTRVGYTKEALVWVYEDERARLNVQEHLTAVREFRINEETRFETVLSEMTAAYYELVRGGDPDDVDVTAQSGPQAGYEKLAFGGEVVVEEYAFGFEGMHLDSSGVKEPIRIIILKGVAKFNGELTFDRKNDDYVGVPVQINALADPTQSAGEELVVFQRVTEAGIPA